MGQGLVVQQIQPQPDFAISDTGTFAIHPLVYDSTNFDLGTLVLGQSTIAQLLAAMDQAGICADIDSAGLSTMIPECPCTADVGVFGVGSSPDCVDGSEEQFLKNREIEAPTVPEGYELIFLLTRGEDKVVQRTSTQGVFGVMEADIYGIHALVYHPDSLDPSLIQAGQTTIQDIAEDIIDRELCAALDTEGVPFEVEVCPCEAQAGTWELLPPAPDCWDNFVPVSLMLQEQTPPVIPSDEYELVYLLSMGQELVVQQVQSQPNFAISDTGKFALHPLVYDSTRFDLSTLVLGQSTIAELMAAMNQAGICADIDSAGLMAMIPECPCTADVGTMALLPPTPDCWDNFTPVPIMGQVILPPVVPEDFALVYLLTSGENLVLQQIAEQPSFQVSGTGMFAVHPFIYDSARFDLGAFTLGQNTIAELMLAVGNSGTCSDIDSAGIATQIGPCPCNADAGTIELLPPSPECWDGITPVALGAQPILPPVVPADFELVYILTSGETLILQQFASQPNFMVSDSGAFAIHPLVYDSVNFDLNTLMLGQSTIADLMAAMNQTGICSDIDSAGISTLIAGCFCNVDAGVFGSGSSPDCIEGDNEQFIKNREIEAPTVPEGYELVFLLSKGEEKAIQRASTQGVFGVREADVYGIHALVYHPDSLDLSLAQIGQRTIQDLFDQIRDQEICADLDVEGVSFEVEVCPCEANGGTLEMMAPSPDCWDNFTPVQLMAQHSVAPTVPENYTTAYFLSQGTILQQFADQPQFSVSDTGMFAIHTVVYDTTQVTIEDFIPLQISVSNILEQIRNSQFCIALDSAGATIDIQTCECTATTGMLQTEPLDPECYDFNDETPVTLTATFVEQPEVPSDYVLNFFLITRDDGIIQQVASQPQFEVNDTGSFAIHTLVLHPDHLNGSLQVGQTTLQEVQQQLADRNLCAAIDMNGVSFEVDTCVTCPASAGVFDKGSTPDCLDGTNEQFLKNREIEAPIIPDGYQLVFLLSKGTDKVIQVAGTQGVFGVRETGVYGIHAFVYDPDSIDIPQLVAGQVSIEELSNDISMRGLCAALDTEGVIFGMEACECVADAGSLQPLSMMPECVEVDQAVELTAEVVIPPSVPTNYAIAYILAVGDSLVISAIGDSLNFSVIDPGTYTIYPLVYPPGNLDLSFVVPGQTQVEDLADFIFQNQICASLGPDGARFEVEACDASPCAAEAGMLQPMAMTPGCWDGSLPVQLEASFMMLPTIPDDYAVAYILTSGETQIIQNVGETPLFQVTDTGDYSIHPLVYPPTDLDLGIAVPGVVTLPEVVAFIEQNQICADLNTTGALFQVDTCTNVECVAFAGTYSAGSSPDCAAADNEQFLKTNPVEAAVVPEGYSLIYLLSQGNDQVILRQSPQSTFGVREGGIYTIHALVYPTDSLPSLSIESGITQIADIQSLIAQTGICANLDGAGVRFEVENCTECPVFPGALRVSASALPCFDGINALTLAAENAQPPILEAGYKLLYVLTQGTPPVITAIADTPVFSVSDSGRFVIYPFVYDTTNFDISFITLGTTTVSDVLDRIQQSNSCTAVWGETEAIYEIQGCFCEANAGSLVATNSPGCYAGEQELFLKFETGNTPNIPTGYQLTYLLTRGNNRVIQQFTDAQTIGVRDTGSYGVWPLVYDPAVLDLNNISLGQTTYEELLVLMTEFEICSSLGREGAQYQILPCGAIQISPDSLLLSGRALTLDAIELTWVFGAPELSRFLLELERSIDGLYFESIAQFEDTSQGRIYIDESFGNSRQLFYRLKLVHSAGVYGYSNVVEINLDELDLSGGFLIYPIPTSDEVFLRPIDPQEGAYFIELFTPDMRQLLDRTVDEFTSEISIGVGDLVPGIYFIGITQPDGSKVGYRIVIER